MINIKNDITKYSEDSRLTVPNKNQKYNLREMIKASERLGRPLSDSETKKIQSEKQCRVSSPKTNAY